MFIVSCIFLYPLTFSYIFLYKSTLIISECAVSDFLDRRSAIYECATEFKDVRIPGVGINDMVSYCR